MIKLILILAAALLLSSGAPAPVPAPREVTTHIAYSDQVVQTTYTIHAVVNGIHRGGYSVPLGEYTAFGNSLEEAAQNARALEAQVRQTATAQAVQHQ
jgi:hypothetical protein